MGEDSRELANAQHSTPWRGIKFEFVAKSQARPSSSDLDIEAFPSCGAEVHHLHLALWCTAPVPAPFPQPAGGDHRHRHHHRHTLPHKRVHTRAQGLGLPAPPSHTGAAMDVDTDSDYMENSPVKVSTGQAPQWGFRALVTQAVACAAPSRLLSPWPSTATCGERLRLVCGWWS